MNDAQHCLACGHAESGPTVGSHCPKCGTAYSVPPKKEPPKGKKK